MASFRDPRETPPVVETYLAPEYCSGCSRVTVVNGLVHFNRYVELPVLNGEGALRRVALHSTVMPMRAAISALSMALAELAQQGAADPLPFAAWFPN